MEPTDPAKNDEKEVVKERLALDRARLRFDRTKAAMEFRLKRRELAGAHSKTWKDLLANPFTLAIVGGFITVMSTIVSNHLSASASIELESTKASLAAEAEAAKNKAAALVAKQSLEAELIKKFVEGPTTQTVRANLKFLVDAGLLPDYAANISTYLEKNPDAAPQVGERYEPRPAVVGGRLTSSAAWPSLVALKNASSPTAGALFCQGTVIGPHSVLTAAHCVSGFERNVTSLSVVREDEKGGKQEIKVARIFVHPSFESHSVIRNDIAILELNASLPAPYMHLSKSLATDPSAGASVKVAAIDVRNFAFLEGSIPIVDGAVCRASMSRGVDQTIQLCAGFVSGDVNACQGASGGPLTAIDPAGRTYQIGITSWGESCTGPNMYGVYTRISAFAEWIAHTVPDLESGHETKGQP